MRLNLFKWHWATDDPRLVRPTLVHLAHLTISRRDPARVGHLQRLKITQLPQYAETARVVAKVLMESSNRDAAIGALADDIRSRFGVEPAPRRLRSIKRRLITPPDTMNRQ